MVRIEDNCFEASEGCSFSSITAVESPRVETLHVFYEDSLVSLAPKTEERSCWRMICEAIVAFFCWLFCVSNEEETSEEDLTAVALEVGGADWLQQVVDQADIEEEDAPVFTSSAPIPLNPVLPTLQQRVEVSAPALPSELLSRWRNMGGCSSPQWSRLHRSPMILAPKPPPQRGDSVMLTLDEVKVKPAKKSSKRQSSLLISRISSHPAINYLGHPNLLVCIWKTLSRKDIHQWRESQQLVYADGQFRPVLKGEKPSSCEVLLDMVKKTFGLQIVSTIEGRLKITSKQEQKPLRWKDVKNLFVCLGANVKKLHIEELFNQIKGKCSLEDDLLCKECLSSEELKALQTAADFQSLNAGQLKLLIDLFRTVPVGDRRIPIMEAFFPEFVFRDGPFDPVKHDKTLLQIFEQVKDLQLGEPELATAEYLAKDLIYQELKPGMIVPMLDEEGNLGYSAVVSCTEHLDDGIIGALLESLSVKKESQPLYWLFRGTLPQISAQESLDGMIADISPDGIGNDGFSHHKRKIIDLILSAINRSKASNVAVHVIGHSLGGALSLRLTSALAERLLAEPLVKVAAIKTITWNSPLIEKKLNDHFRQVLENLYQEHSSLQLSLVYGLFEGDWIQSLGGGKRFGVRLGFAIPSPNLQRGVIIHSNESVTGFHAHHAKAYRTSSQSPPFTRVIIDEHTPKEGLDKILGCHWHLDANNFSLVLWSAEDIGLKIRWLGQEGLYQTVVGVQAIAKWLRLTGRLSKSRVDF